MISAANFVWVVKKNYSYVSRVSAAGVFTKIASVYRTTKHGSDKLILLLISKTDMTSLNKEADQHSEQQTVLANLVNTRVSPKLASGENRLQCSTMTT